MKLGFEESQSAYTSASQNARAWTEAWVSAWAYCPHCGNAKIASFPNNSPLADFYCTSCNEEFELKSQKEKFGAKVLDGEFKTKCERLAASNNPNLLLLNYDLKSLAVVNLFIVPKHFFVREIIGSKILLDRVPESGKIHIVRGSVIRAKELVLAEWQKTLFLRNESPETRGWLLDVMKCVEHSASATSRLTKSTPSKGISAISIPATRTSNPRFVSNFNFCAIGDLSISCRVVIIVCDLEEARMAWFLNHYTCYRCHRDWSDAWSCMCDDECPHCGARDMTPYESEDLTAVIEEEGKEFVVFWSPETAEHDPDYRELGRFPSREKALEFLSADR